jgi:hypothetical protein
MFFMSFMLKASLKGASMHTFISLIPKKYGVVDIEDFHAINLVDGIYKIISRVLS